MVEEGWEVGICDVEISKSASFLANHPEVPAFPVMKTSFRSRFRSEYVVSRSTRTMRSVAKLLKYSKNEQESKVFDLLIYGRRLGGKEAVCSLRLS